MQVGNRFDTSCDQPPLRHGSALEIVLLHGEPMLPEVDLGLFPQSTEIGHARVSILPSFLHAHTMPQPVRTVPSAAADTERGSGLGNRLNLERYVGKMAAAALTAVARVPVLAYITAVRGGLSVCSRHNVRQMVMELVGKPAISVSNVTGSPIAMLEGRVRGHRS